MDNDEPPVSASTESSNTTIRQLDQEALIHYTGSKVDHYHFINRLMEPISKSHGAYLQLAHAITDAILVKYHADVDKVSAYLATQGKDFDDEWWGNHDWMVKRVRRYAPDPKTMERQLLYVMDNMRNIIDATTGQPLIPQWAYDKMLKQLVHIRKGCVADPPGIQLYYPIGYDANGLMKYRCIRGTNYNEGATHRNLISKFGAFNAGPRLAFCMLLEFATRKNMKATHKNMGAQNYGHYDPWLMDTLVQFKDIEWISSEWLDFKNIFIIGPYGGTENLPQYDPDFVMRPSLKFLAERMNLRIPITPIHTVEEMALFKFLRANFPSDLFKILQEFNAKADGKKIFYKIMEHLEKHQKHRDSNANRNATLISAGPAANVQHPPVHIPKIVELEEENQQEEEQVVSPAEDLDQEQEEIIAENADAVDVNLSVDNDLNVEDQAVNDETSAANVVDENLVLVTNVQPPIVDARQESSLNSSSNNGGVHPSSSRKKMKMSVDVYDSVWFKAKLVKAYVDILTKDKTKTQVDAAKDVKNMFPSLDSNGKEIKGYSKEL